LGTTILTTLPDESMLAVKDAFFTCADLELKHVATPPSHLLPGQKLVYSRWRDEPFHKVALRQLAKGYRARSSTLSSQGQ
jgi:hypothetical protein